MYLWGVPGVVAGVDAAVDDVSQLLVEPSLHEPLVAHQMRNTVSTQTSHTLICDSNDGSWMLQDLRPRVNFIQFSASRMLPKTVTIVHQLVKSNVTTETSKSGSAFWDCFRRAGPHVRGRGFLDQRSDCIST